MRTVSDNAARSWLKQRRIEESSGHLSFQGEQKVTQLHLASPSSREAITALAVNLVGVLGVQSEWLLWLRDFNIASDNIEEVGWKVIDDLAGLARQPQLNVDSSAFLFEPSETVALKVALLIPILFMWDAYLVKGNGDTFVYINHDDHSFISTRSASVANEIQSSQLKSWIVKPEAEKRESLN